MTLFSATSFLVYGAACFLSRAMAVEFERYRLARQRQLVGALQVAAAFGLILGLREPWIGRAAATGLTVMMLLAVGVRIKIKDSFAQALPAFFFFALNAYLALAAVAPPHR
ncbi:MAG: DoxX family protein [Chthoniobacterales bacterium]